MAVVSELAVAIYGFKSRRKIVEPAGISYELLVVRDRLALGLSTLPIYKSIASVDSSASDLEKLADDSDLTFMDKDDSKYLKYISRLDPSDFKEQDHYRVLGLSKLRYKATANQLKLAYRQKVLKYHPDKGSVEGKDSQNERIFACIQKAYEQLGFSTDKRRAYDSVDPTFDESIPNSSEITKQNFFEVLGPVFERNSRFSIRQPALLLGDENSDRSCVDAFYDFWFNWSSWREFSYLDSEDKTKGEDKWERREIEKVNKAEREKRRKKDVKRISNLVDLTYGKDPRVVAFKEFDRQQKELFKIQKKQERNRKKQERKLQEEEEERAQELNRKIQMEQETQANLVKSEERNSCVQNNNERNQKEQLSTTSDWSSAELQILVKAVSLYPPGTLKRWRLVSDYVTNHAPTIGGKERSEKEVIKQVKALNAVDSSSTPANQIKDSNSILRENGAALVTDNNNSINNNKNAKEAGETLENNTATNWTAQQQKQLEAALKSIPGSDLQRWEKIAEMVNGKTKKDCIKRYKHLAEMVKQAKNKS